MPPPWSQNFKTTANAYGHHNELVKPIQKWSLGCGLAVCLCCGGPLTCFFAPSGNYPVGANIKDLGLTPDNTRYFIWAPGSREPITVFAKRRQVRLAHFTGSIELSRPGTSLDRTELHFLDGKLAYHHAPYHDPWLAEDYKALQTGRLSDMLAKTKNDWRIENHNNHFIEPEGPFTGEITITLRSGYPFTTVAVLNVKSDLILRSSRSFLLTID